MTVSLSDVTFLGECIEFMFKGCGGNQNRFGTKEECLDGCRSLSLCGKGLPLMDFAGNIKRCDGDRLPCPGSHVCIGEGMTSVCCQKAGERQTEIETLSRSHLSILCPRRIPLWSGLFDSVGRLSKVLPYTFCLQILL